MFFQKQKQKLFPEIEYEKESMIGKRLNFAAAEAYKLLRTNIMFSLADDDRKQRVIGVTSSVKGEGKSLTSINIAYTIAETGKKVLLMECDLRLPTMAKRLNLPKTPGLTNLLIGMNNSDEIIHKDVLVKGLDVIVTGSVPPNPAELLDSKRMEYTVERFSEFYDCVILDLPPVTVVSDALIVSKLTSGMIIVARQDYVTKSALAETVRQLKYANAKIMGFVVSDAHSERSPYKGKYYKKYGYEYGNGYENKTESKQ